MRTRTVVAVLPAIVLTFAPLAQASDVGLLVEHVDLREADATRLLHTGRPGRDATALRAAVGKLVAAGEAQLVEIAYAHGRTGEANKIGSLHEFRYPTEWDPPEIPSEIEAPVTAEMDVKVPANPTAFRSRDLGNSLEFKARQTVEGDINLAITSETAELLPRRQVGNRELGVESPQFAVRKLSAEFICHDRRPVLAGVFTPRHPELRDRRVMVFATAFLRTFRTHRSNLVI